MNNKSVQKEKQAPKTELDISPHVVPPAQDHTRVVIQHYPDNLLQKAVSNADKIKIQKTKK